MIESLRTWWQEWTGEDVTPFDGSLPSWVASMFFHMGLLVFLVLLSEYVPPNESHLEVTSAETTSEEPELMPAAEEFYFSNQVEEQIGANSVGGGTGAAFAMAPVVSEISAVPVMTSAAVQTSEFGTQRINIGKINEEIKIATGPHFSENLVVKGAAGVGTTGAVGAIDRITHEIMLSLEERKTLVVWLYDKTLSIKPQRETFNERLDRIFEELGVIQASGNDSFKKHDSKPLLNAVVSFGKDITFELEKPSDEISLIKTAVAGIKTDDSGTERVFTAIYQAVEKYRSYRTQSPRRNIMFVVFTDEVGDDEEGLDPTVAICRKFEIPVYCVGVPAPFGRREVAIKYVPEKPADDKVEYDLSPQWIPVRQGPESFQPEMVQLAFSNAKDKDKDEAMDSGFGPYSLTRLCYETGGIYFTVHPNRNVNRSVTRQETAELSARLTHFFDPEVMRNYRPDYVSIKEYQKLVSENKARQVLLEVAQASHAAVMGEPDLEFPKTSEADLANQLSKAQQIAAVVEPQLIKLYEVLKMGEKDRTKLTTPRWQAGYDLAMGRVLAAKVRAESYNAMLAKAKQGMKFKNEKNDTWVLVPADEISVGSALEKQKEQAKTYLERVVTDHKDTPWAMLASRELETPLGWKWDEKNTGIAAAANNAAAAAAAAAANAPERRQMMRKPLPKPPAPKL